MSHHPVNDWPLYWFAKLESAIADGDTAGAEAAQQELRRLGVSVSLTSVAEDRMRHMARAAVEASQRRAAAAVEKRSRRGGTA